MSGVKGKSGVYKHRSRTDEEKFAVSLRFKGRHLSEETKRKIAISLQGNKNGIGHLVSKEHKKKISETQRGKKKSNETKLRISFATKVKKKPPRSLEHCKKISERQKERFKKGILNIGAKGEKNLFWIKDRTKLKTSERKDLDVQYKNWRKEVKDRDNWNCRLSSNDCKGRLESHHIFNWIDYPELRYVINNGITLCAFHHPRGREEEKRMIPILQELLSVSKE